MYLDKMKGTTYLIVPLNLFSFEFLGCPLKCPLTFNRFFLKPLKLSPKLFGYPFYINFLLLIHLYDKMNFFILYNFTSIVV